MLQAFPNEQPRIKSPLDVQIVHTFFCKVIWDHSFACLATILTILFLPGLIVATIIVFIKNSSYRLKVQHIHHTGNTAFVWCTAYQRVPSKPTKSLHYLSSKINRTHKKELTKQNQHKRKSVCIPIEGSRRKYK